MAIMVQIIKNNYLCNGFGRCGPGKREKTNLNNYHYGLRN